MGNLTTLIAAIVILVILIKWDAEEIRLRVELLFSGFGVDYKPGKFMCFIVATGLFYLVYCVIIER